MVTTKIITTKQQSLIHKIKKVINVDISLDCNDQLSINYYILINFPNIKEQNRKSTES